MSVVSVTELIEAITVVPDPSGTPFKENLTEIGGNTVATGVGASDAGTQRVALSTDSQVIPANITGKFRESFETFTPGVFWNLSTGTNDIVQIDGNAVSASYLVISKDPFTVGTETVLETIDSFRMPLETATGISMSQRVYGQELSLELISTETPITPVSDIAISSIQQATSTLTVTTSTPHGLVPGKRIGIYGVSDSRLNYAALVILSTPTATQFTCTSSPVGTLPTLTVGPYTNQGYIYYRPSLGYAPNGISEIFENTSTSNASCYSRANAGDALPTGTLGGNQSVSTAGIQSSQAINSPYTYAFLPTSEFRFVLQADRAQWMDAAVDTAGAPTSRVYRTQVVPDPSKEYKLRFRVTNDKGLTVPSARIISASKSGSTTATITTAEPHGLTTFDYVYVQGIRDTTNFAYSSTALAVLSTPSSTTFTVNIGTSYTGTSYGGFVARAQGYNLPPSFPTVAVQSISVVSNELNLTASGNWSWLIGDYVNVYGVRENLTGNNAGVDGTYKVVDVSTTAIRLAPIDPNTVLPVIGAMNAGGAVIKRSDVRIAFVRIFDYERERVEVQSNGAQAASVPVVGTVSINGGSNIIPYNQNIYNALTSTSLGASATYTGSTLNAAASTTSTTMYNTSITVAVQHTAGLVPGTLFYEVGYENSSTTPTTWYPAFVIPIPSTSSWTCFTFPLSTRYYRIRFVNGSTAQTSFRLALLTQYNGSMSNGLTYPDTITYPLSTTNLTGGATFTSATLDFGDTMSIYKTITAQAYTDQASATNGFKIQVSRDGSTWRDAVSMTTVANTINRIQWGLVYRYARIVYTNGASAQTAFELYANADVR